MAVIKVPSVGRTVHYKAYGTPGGEYAPGEVRAAIVTGVLRPGDPYSSLSLYVITPTGAFFNGNVEYGDGPGQWNWPAYVPEMVVTE